MFIKLKSKQEWWQGEHKKAVELYFHCGAFKKQQRNKAYLNGYSDFEESLFWKYSKSIRNNNDNKSDYNKMTKVISENSNSNNNGNNNNDT